jgi:hypothetical protein
MDNAIDLAPIVACRPLRAEIDIVRNNSIAG